MSDTRSFWTGVLITVGALMTVLCGGCTLWWLGAALTEWGRGGEAGAYAQLVVMVALLAGGLPTLVGLLLLRAGMRRRR